MNVFKFAKYLNGSLKVNELSINGDKVCLGSNKVSQPRQELCVNTYMLLIISKCSFEKYAL